MYKISEASGDSLTLGRDAVSWNSKAGYFPFALDLINYNVI